MKNICSLVRDEVCSLVQKQIIIKKKNFFKILYDCNGKSKYLYLCVNVVSTRRFERVSKLPITNTYKLLRKNDKKFYIAIKNVINVCKIVK